MAVALDIIKTAMRHIGALATGETPTADEASDGLQALNDVLETWNLEGMMVYSGLVLPFVTVAGQSTYTIGTGGNWNTPRPIRISDAYCTVNGTDFPIEIIGLSEYDGISLKTQQQSIVERLVYVNDYPLAKVILWPVPASVITVSLDSDTILSSIATTATAISLPPGYQRALQYATAVELTAQYGNSIDVTRQAQATKALVKRANRQPQIMSFDPMLTGGGVFIGARGY